MKSHLKWVLWVAFLVSVGIAAWVAFLAVNTHFFPRGHGFVDLLDPLINDTTKSREISIVAQAIKDAFNETRLDAMLWSFVYWGMIFFATFLTAASGVILKMEHFFKGSGVADHDHLKKDIAATFSVLGALLITFSTTGDFHEKWRVNRIAAAQIEKEGSRLYTEKDVDPKSIWGEIRDIQYARNLAIAGEVDQKREKKADPANTAASKPK